MIRKGVFIPDITVEMFRNATLESVEDMMTSGYMEDIEIPERPHGEWIPINIHAETWDYKCSVCGAEVDIDFPNCPYCLANMQKKEGGVE